MFSKSVSVKTETFKVRDSKTGEMREYHSIEDVPEEHREKIREALKAAGLSSASTKITWTDASGTVHHYNSVEEMPPEFRALYEKTLGS